jgi:hypothetical protein
MSKKGKKKKQVNENGGKGKGRISRRPLLLVNASAPAPRAPEGSFT